MKSIAILLQAAILTYLAALDPSPAQAQDESLGVMTFNIRYDNPDDPNPWEDRKDEVINLIRFHEPAFVGIQEALHHQLKDLDEGLAHYQYIGKGRKDGKQGGEYSALLYDRRKVSLVPGSNRTIWLSKTPKVPSKNWDAALPRILTWGAFRVKESGKTIYVFNTHFDHVGERARAESAKIILDAIAETAGDQPVVLTGDFNIVDDSEPYRILTSSFLSDAYYSTDLPHTGAEFTYSGFKVTIPQEGRRIDYIFTNDRVNVIKHATLTSFRDGYFPSDHLPVLAYIMLR
ncbi:endonuclease/exonuclease/phosphatase family protein [Fodinibius sediminis]|uniref:Metal-dependent hydrolase, endonuclease/exonuclease/phosphatase family n=1 Tax=Fodinibius sediminis TaxID=1214077 RepID=A0A521CVT7_9BACT|nr:endonuclease/exonuclease/phosphatase family protein [Fodinibius sediminis]SMO63538.1 Metal-dependent hydrolase, endonuclease/exonuclease/phosphatase family [Fodinibius sediminis]